MTDIAQLGDELQELAHLLVSAAKGEGFDRQLEAMKVCGQWHLGMIRANGKEVGDPPQDTGLPAMRRRIEEASQGGK